jgi:hypothetical protein
LRATDGLRRSGNGQVKVKMAASDPTSTTYATEGRARGAAAPPQLEGPGGAERHRGRRAALYEIYDQGLDVRAVQAGYLSLARRLR